MRPTHPLVVVLEVADAVVDLLVALVIVLLITIVALLLLLVFFVELLVQDVLLVAVAVEVKVPLVGHCRAIGGRRRAQGDLG